MSTFLSIPITGFLPVFVNENQPEMEPIPSSPYAGKKTYVLPYSGYFVQWSVVQYIGLFMNSGCTDHAYVVTSVLPFFVSGLCAIKFFIIKRKASSEDETCRERETKERVAALISTRPLGGCSSIA
jgi:hypothetical protein